MKSIDTIAVLGDSSSSGFGTRGRSYGVVLGESLGASRVEVFADFGRTTRELLDQHASWLAGVGPDLVVVQSGMADGLMHPGRRVQSFLEHFAPKTWHGVDGLERRAVFSKTRRVRMQQWATSTAKTLLKRAAVSLTGGYTRMQPDEYAECLDRLLSELEGTTGIVVCLGLYEIDAHFFPCQAASTARFKDARREVLARHPKVIGVEVDPVLVHWDCFLADHGHWNADGHAAVGAEIARCVRAALSQSSDPGLTSTPV